MGNPPDLLLGTGASPNWPAMWTGGARLGRTATAQPDQAAARASMVRAEHEAFVRWFRSPERQARLATRAAQLDASVQESLIQMRNDPAMQAYIAALREAEDADVIARGVTLEGDDWHIVKAKSRIANARANGKTVTDDADDAPTYDPRDLRGDTVRTLTAVRFPSWVRPSADSNTYAATAT